MPGKATRSSRFFGSRHREGFRNRFFRQGRELVPRAKQKMLFYDDYLDSGHLHVFDAQTSHVQVSILRIEIVRSLA